MTMITGGDVTQEDRIRDIRKLSGDIEDFVRSNDEIDDIGTRADNFVGNSVGQFTWTGSENNFLTFISASNCMAAVEILRGIGGAINNTIANDLARKVNELVKILNGNSEQQVKPEVRKTQGINNQDGTF